MLTALRARRQDLFQGFWLIPGAIAILFVGVALGVINLDRLLGPTAIGIAFTGDAPAARSVLSTIAQSLITVAGITLSITILTLQLVSNQFSPRAIRLFLSDRIDQIAVGTFVGIFLYCLLVLRSIRDQGTTSPGFVPGLAITLAIALAGLGLGMLLVFIHHVAQSTQVSDIASGIARQTIAAIDRVYGDDSAATEQPSTPQIAHLHPQSCYVYPTRSSYVQKMELNGISGSLAKHMSTPICLHAEVTAGDFVTEEIPLVSIWPAPDPIAPVERLVRRAVSISSSRDIEQDVAYGIRQLVDIALRAVSPGVNDPTTAVTCIAYLRSCLERRAQRRFPSAVQEHPNQPVTLVMGQRSFGGYLHEAFDELARSNNTDSRVFRAILVALGAVLQVSQRRGARDHAEAVRRVIAEVVSLAPSETPGNTERQDLTRLGRQMLGQADDAGIIRTVT